MTIFLIDFEGSDKGITFNLNPEYPPVDGGLHWIDATFPDRISTTRNQNFMNCMYP